jgi:cobalt-precorrin-7 (C5)-methyltransferase
VLYVVGAGPGDPDYITIKALKTLEKCQVVAGWPSVLKRLPLEGKDIAQLSYRNQEEELRRLAALSLEADVCLVAHGDPTVSDWELMGRVRALGVPFEVINGVSSINVALAKAGLDLTQVVVVSQHAKSPQPLPMSDCGRNLVVIPPPDTDGVKRAIAEVRSLGCRPLIMEDLTLPSETVRPAEGDVSVKSNLVILICIRPTEGTLAR